MTRLSRHLAPEELLDIAEGTCADTSFPHLDTCAACRQQLAAMRDTIATVSSVEVPEPSPLFWDHFSARVHDAVTTAEIEPRWPWRLAGIVAVAAALILAVGLSLRGGGPSQTAPDAAVAAAAGDVADPAALTSWPADDPSLGFVADLAADIDWDAAADQGFGTTIGLSSRVDVLADLSAEESIELQRLLSAELSSGSAGPL